MSFWAISEWSPLFGVPCLECEEWLLWKESGTHSHLPEIWFHLNQISESYQKENSTSTRPNRWCIKYSDNAHFVTYLSEHVIV